MPPAEFEGSLPKKACLTCLYAVDFLHGSARFLAEAVRDRRLADDAYNTDIVEGIRLVDALRRAQETGFAPV
jgi:hypothetical protein